MFTPSRYVADFSIAGMRYWDGALVLRKLKPGTRLRLMPETDNPHDANAVALYWKDAKLGYIPRSANELPAQLLRFGHKKVIECRILKVDRSAETWNQVQVGLYITDKRAENR